MSLCAYDVNGYVGEVASLGGWRELASWARGVGGALRDLVDTGFTTDPGALAAKLEAQTIADPVIDATRRNLALLARSAQDALIISDGVVDEAAEPRTAAGFDAGQPRDSHGRWEQVSDSHERAKTAHWEAADWHRKAALNPNLGPTAMAATRKAIELTQIAVGRDTGATEANDWAQTALDEANIGDHGSAVGAHETAGSLHRERQHAALTKMKAAAVNATREQLLEEERRDVIATREMRRLRAAGSAQSGNRGHKGRPGQVGGSAPSTTAPEPSPIPEGIIVQAGLKWIKPSHLALVVRESLEIPPNRDIYDLMPDQFDAFKQVGPALDTIQKEYPGLADYIRKTFTFSVAPFEPKDSSHVTVTGKDEYGRPVHNLIFNSAAQHIGILEETMKAAGSHPTYAWRRAKDVVNNGGSLMDGVREAGRLAWVHEFGHVRSEQTNKRIENNLVKTLRGEIAKGNWSSVQEWMSTNISGYANYSKGEAVAEAFTRAVEHDLKAPALSDWLNEIKKD